MAGSQEMRNDGPNLLSLWRSLLQSSPTAGYQSAFPNISVVDVLKEALERRENIVDVLVALNCLSMLCHSNEDMKKKVIRSGILESLTSMLAPTDGKSGDSLASRRESLVKHEEAAQLAMKLSYFSGEKLYKDFVTSAILGHVGNVCNETSYMETHSQCCSTGPQLSSCSYIEKHLLNKRLIGKLNLRKCPDSVAGLKTDLLCYDAELYCPDTKQMFNKKLSKEGILWNGQHSLLNRDASVGILTDVAVTKVLDNGWFFAHVGANVTQEMICGIDAVIDAEQCMVPLPKEQLKPGESVVIHWGKRKYARAELLSIFDTLTSAIVFLIDYGFTVKVLVDSIFSVPDRVAAIRPQVSFCHLSGLSGTQPCLRLLEFCSGVLSNCSSHASLHRSMLLFHKVPDLLVSWCSFPSRRLVLHSLGALCNLSMNTLFKPILGYNGCCQACLEVLTFYKDDHDVVRLALKCLGNLTSENVVNRLRVARHGGLHKMVFAYHRSNDNDMHKLCLQALRSVVKNSWDLLYSPFVPDLRSVKSKQEATDCHHMLSSYGRDKTESGLLQRNQESISSLSLQQFHALQEKCHKACAVKQDDADKRSIGEHSTRSEQFIFLDWVQVKANVTYDFIAVACLKELKVGDLSSRLCALLNGAQDAFALIGIGPGGVVAGLSISRKQRDDARLSIDSLLLEFNPRVKHSVVKVDFVPVVTKADSTSNLQNQSTMCHFEERYVIQIKITPTPGNRYTTMGGKYYVFLNGKAVRQTAQEMRETLLEQMEAKFKSEINVLRKAIANVKQRQ